MLHILHRRQAHKRLSSREARQLDLEIGVIVGRPQTPLENTPLGCYRLFLASLPYTMSLLAQFHAHTPHTNRTLYSDQRGPQVADIYAKLSLGPARSL